MTNRLCTNAWLRPRPDHCLQPAPGRDLVAHPKGAPALCDLFPMGHPRCETSVAGPHTNMNTEKRQ
jgi:hypothetical protein